VDFEDRCRTDAEHGNTLSGPGETFTSIMGYQKCSMELNSTNKK